MHHDTIAIVDFGGQTAHLISTKIRRLGVHAIICDPQAPIERFTGAKGIILSGSPALSSQGESQDYTQAIYDLDVPMLGLCFGHQEIARHYGGRVAHQQREFGLARLEVIADSPLLAGLAKNEQVFMSHGDTVVELPEGFVEVGMSTLGEGSHHNAAIADETRRRYGFQFHPEVGDTVNGDKMLENFAVGICGCDRSWNMAAYLEQQIERTRAQAGGADDDRAVFLLASGGVDSTVCAWLLGRAVGPDRLHLLHIDTGMMRLDESAAVMAAFREHEVSHNLHFVDASARFLGALDGVDEPEKKRLIIGNTFIDVFQDLFRDKAESLGLDKVLLAQGTIYPDTIESGGTKRSDKIKTHHNRVPIIEELLRKGEVIEPLDDLYKVEVRELGHTLGVPPHFIDRHPFPGPGLGVRVLCAQEEPADYEPERLLAEATPVAARYGLGVLPLPVRSVGVKADRRCYESPLLLHADDWDWERVELAATELFKHVAGINRCVLALGPKGPSKAAPIAAGMTRERLDVLREADALVMEGLRRHELMQTIWQCPTVLVPVAIDGAAGEMLVLRPVLSDRAMTARPAPLPAALISELTKALLALDGVGAVTIDVTSKPPGTIEWE